MLRFAQPLEKPFSRGHDDDVNGQLLVDLKLDQSINDDRESFRCILDVDRSNQIEALNPPTLTAQLL